MQKLLPLSAVFVLLLAASVTAQPAAKPAAKPVPPVEPPALDPRLKPLPFHHIGPFITLGDGSVMCVTGDAAYTTRDEDGANWSSTPIFDERAKMKVRPEQALLRTTDGTIVLIFLNDLDKRWKWDKTRNTHDGEVHLYEWSIRSTDEGKTWSKPVLVQDGYSGAVRDLIETESGVLVHPGQKYLTDKYRHATIPYVSTDKGLTWKATGLLDVGGRGHHDGSIESCLVQLRDKRLWMLLRTNHDFLYESYSSDDGMTWSPPAPTKIDASSSPAIVKRLASGRLALVWNRLYLEGKTDGPRRGGNDSAANHPSWQREELAFALSDDDGKTWTAPAIIARGKRVAYPYLFERRPGVLWVTTMQGGLHAVMNESDFVKGK